ncbi:Hypothetical protein CINCED_3A024599 [Cinara cedri]|uniref:Uncharacterized protein n=1 Tax=Cinara cedri TaxID=506608 RepID=A0A5E4NCZ2_9HEMI|nr:Hypothetical protein CINCED_3A024599 [Cinara cedri]
MDNTNIDFIAYGSTALDGNIKYEDRREREKGRIALDEPKSFKSESNSNIDMVPEGEIRKQMETKIFDNIDTNERETAKGIWMDNKETFPGKSIDVEFIKI